MSAGKYNTILYYNGKTAYSTSIGGIATIILLIVLLSYGIIIFIGIFNQDIFNILENELDFNKKDEFFSDTHILNEYSSEYSMSV